MKTTAKLYAHLNINDYEFVRNHILINNVESIWVNKTTGNAVCVKWYNDFTKKVSYEF